MWFKNIASMSGIMLLCWSIACTTDTEQASPPVALDVDRPLHVEQVFGNVSDVTFRPIHSDGAHAIAIGQRRFTIPGGASWASHTHPRYAECWLTQDGGASWSPWTCPELGRFVVVAHGAAFITANADDPGLYRQALPDGSPERVVSGEIHDVHKASDGAILVELADRTYHVSTDGGERFSPLDEGSHARLAELVRAEVSKAGGDDPFERERHANSDHEYRVQAIYHADPQLLMVLRIRYSLDEDLYDYGPPPDRAVIVRTSDGGASWELVRVEQANPRAHLTPYLLPAVHGLLAHDTTVALLTKTAAPLSRDKGETWEDVGAGIWSEADLIAGPHDFMTLSTARGQGSTSTRYPAWSTALAGNHEVWLAGGSRGRLARSTDRGRTWSSPTAQDFSAVWRSGEVAIAAGLGPGLHRSKDGGKSWDIVVPRDPDDTQEQRCLKTPDHTVLGGDDSALFIGGSFKDTTFLCRSLDRGESWEQVWFGEKGSATPYHRIESFQFAGGRALLLTDRALLRSDDRGDSWSPVPLPDFDAQKPPSPRMPAGVMAFDGTRVFIATWSMIWRSDDAGETWSHVAREPRSTLLRAAAFRGDTLIVVGNGQSIFRSTDGGATLDRVHEGDEALFGLTERDGNWVAAGGLGRVLLSTDDGASWTALDSGTGHHLLRAVDLARDGSLLLVGHGGYIGRATQTQ
ncbi:MAG: hypothetical protein EA397_12410 [Deltaproteobacteria bacterium]|nr:MAG: hypothetical protein EA397_12410 [Deltaproteobacteria bacterium]